LGSQLAVLGVRLAAILDRESLMKKK